MTKIQLKPIPPLYSFINNINSITYINMFGDPSPLIEAIAAARRGDALKALEKQKREDEKIKREILKAQGKI